MQKNQFWQQNQRFWMNGRPTPCEGYTEQERHKAQLHALFRSAKRLAMNKKANGPPMGGPVTVLLVGILIFYFLYLMSLPSSQVGQYVGGGQDIFTSSDQPGQIIQRPSYYDQIRQQRGVNLGSLHLFSGTQEVSTLIAKELKVSSSWGEKLPQTRRFQLEDLQKARITFDVIRKQGNGNMILTFNGQKILDEQKYPGSEVSIEVPAANTNSITISAQTPPLPFTQNSYELSDLQITGIKLLDNTRQIIQTSLERPARGIFATASITRPDTLIIVFENQTIFQRYLDTPQTLQAAFPIDKQTTSPRVEFKIQGSGDINLNDITII